MTTCWWLRYIWEKRDDARNQGDGRDETGSHGQGQTFVLEERKNSEHEIVHHCG